MRFNNVKNLAIRALTLKDPVTFGMQLGKLWQFSVEGITFDYNLKRANMDGVHLNGNCRWGRVANLKGTTNDDMVALNADDGGWAEMSRGPIEDVLVDGLFSEDGYTAVRLLSAGSPVKRVQIANVFGAYRRNVVSFTNHRVHLGTASTFEDISIRGVFCSKSGMGVQSPILQSGGPSGALVWINAPAVVTCLTISDFHRSEAVWTAENVSIERCHRGVATNEQRIAHQPHGCSDRSVDQPGDDRMLEHGECACQGTGGPATLDCSAKSRDNQTVHALAQSGRQHPLHTR